MAKLVVLTQSMAGRSCELAAERTTIGRVEDNAFQIAEPSVSSRHCEILLRGSDVVVKDLNSTNGTFINGEKVTAEAVLKPGQTLRLGNIDLRLEVPGAAAAPAAPPTPAAPSASPSAKKEAARAATGGVSLSDLESGGRATGTFDTNSVFTKKKKSKNMYFWIIVGVAILVILGLILYAISLLHGNARPQS